jgi:hypothetical protein
MVDDVPSAAPQVLAIGARHLDGEVYADPSGHPFCLITGPHRAHPIHPLP